jgi:uncharacterized SAM-binding protein YcdF (DUF218 family)
VGFLSRRMGKMKTVTSASAPARRWREAESGLVLGTLVGLGALQLVRGVVPLVGTDVLVPVSGILGAALGPTRGRGLLWGAAVVVVLALAIVGGTPLVDHLIRGFTRTDPLEPAPAVVVLAATLQKDQELGDDSQARLLHGYELLGQGHAQTLVLTSLRKRPSSYRPTVERQMQQLGLHRSIEEVGPVTNTHDEAIAVARLARERGWDHVLLVTQPWHMRRAAAVFEKAGLRVRCSPCVEGQYDTNNLGSMSARLAAFRDWAHEVVGYQVYRLRGWL